MEILTVTDIIEEDFGCEGRPAGQEPKVTVVARDSAGGERQFVIPDRLAYDLGLHTGVKVSVDGSGAPIPYTRQKGERCGKI